MKKYRIWHRTVGSPGRRRNHDRQYSATNVRFFHGHLRRQARRQTCWIEGGHSMLSRCTPQNVNAVTVRLSIKQVSLFRDREKWPPAMPTGVRACPGHAEKCSAEKEYNFPIRVLAPKQIGDELLLAANYRRFFTARHPRM